jgi:hemolysin activation/secretion protein
VKDSKPLHASAELNNRHGPGTTALRANGSVSATNLWQLGHTAGLSFQTSPEKTSEVKVFSGYYIAPVAEVSGLSLLAQGTKQDSNVSTLGGVAVAGRGETLGLRALVALPALKDFYQSASLGFDWKRFDQQVSVAGVVTTAPVSYFPLVAGYNAGWFGPGVRTDFDTDLVFHVRGLGSSPAAFNNSRFKAGGDFIYLRADLAQTRDLPGGFQLYGKAQGQLASGPLLSAEQIVGGGLGTARGYLEGEVAGDRGIFGTVELRGPSFAPWLGTRANDARLYVFADAGRLAVSEPLPGQTARFDLLSVGAGASFRVFDHFNVSFDLGLPQRRMTCASPFARGPISDRASR